MASDGKVGLGWQRFAWLGNIVLLLLAWEIVGSLQLVASGVLPPPSAILIKFWVDKADYPPHVAATLQASVLGFIIGNGIAIAAGVVFAMSPLCLRLFRGVNIAIFALPPIAISPVLVLTLSGMTPRVVLAALGCYFATMTATVIGLTQADSRSMDVVRAYGGSSWTRIKLVQMRSALPSILGGFRIAAPAAVLGAILAEFGGGGRFGVGTYLLGSLGRADPPRLWGIGLMATFIAGLAYALFAIIGNRVVGVSRAVTVPASAPVAPASIDEPVLTRLAIAVSAAALPLILWWIAEWLATGTGLGNLFNQSRGYLDYGMIWTVAAMSVLIAVLFYFVVVVIERYTLARLGMNTAE